MSAIKSAKHIVQIYQRVTKKSFFSFLIFQSTLIALSELALVYSGIKILEATLGVGGGKALEVPAVPIQQYLFIIVVIATVIRINESKKLLTRVHAFGYQLVTKLLELRFAYNSSFLGNEINDKEFTTLMTSHIQTYVSSLLTFSIAITSVTSLFAIMIVVVASNSLTALIPFAALGAVYLVVLKISGDRIADISQTIALSQKEAIVEICEALEIEEELKINSNYLSNIQRITNIYRRLLSSLAQSSFISASPKLFVEGALFAMLLALPILGGLNNSQGIENIAIACILAVRFLPFVQSLYASATNLKTYHVSIQLIAEQLSSSFEEQNMKLIESRTIDQQSIELKVIRRRPLTDNKLPTWLLLPYEYYYFKKCLYLSTRVWAVQLSMGGLIVIEGVSGIGKSSLLRYIIQISNYYRLMPSENIDIEYVPPSLSHTLGGKKQNLRIGYLQQSTRFRSGTIQDNLFGSYSETCDSVAANLLTEMGLADDYKTAQKLMKCKIGEGSNHSLSGGELKRLMICKAILAEPDILLLDEATAGLDLGSEKKVLSYLKQSSICTILVSHSPFALDAADSIISLGKRGS